MKLAEQSSVYKVYVHVTQQPVGDSIRDSNPRNDLTTAINIIYSRADQTKNHHKLKTHDSSINDFLRAKVHM